MLLRGSTAHAESSAEGEAAGPAPVHVALAQAVHLAQTQGLDVLIAEAEIRGAAADTRAAGAAPNPDFRLGAGRVLRCAGNVCDGTPWGWNAGLTDNGLVEGAITRKRALRERVAQRAMEAARFSRADAIRLVVAQTKVQYIQTAAAFERLEFARDFARTLHESVAISRVKYPRVIDEGQLARVEQESLRADQNVDRSLREWREEQIQLTLVMGMARGRIPDITVDSDVLRFRVPTGLVDARRDDLLRLAVENRPDRKALVARAEQADAQVQFARRSRVPDVSVSIDYSQVGSGPTASSPPTLAVGVAVPLPLFYQQQGAVGRAEADRDAAALSRAKLDATVAADIESGFTAFSAARQIVTRFESVLLQRAKRAVEITTTQYRAGSATLTDLLDAQRTFVAVNGDYYAELVNYWTAVFSLEEAVGKELLP